MKECYHKIVLKVVEEKVGYVGTSDIDGHAVIDNSHRFIKIIPVCTKCDRKMEIFGSKRYKKSELDGSEWDDYGRYMFGPKGIWLKVPDWKKLDAKKVFKESFDIGKTFPDNRRV